MITFRAWPNRNPQIPTVDAQRKALLLAAKAILESPPLAPFGGNLQIKDRHHQKGVEFDVVSNPEFLREVMSAERLNRNGIFDAKSVEKLIGNMGGRKTITENENMAVAGILSTQILVDLFINGNNPYKESKMRVNCPVKYDKRIID